MSGPFGRFELCGEILAKWNSLGRQNSFVGWPKSNENVLSVRNGRSTVFERATIYWSSATGAHPVGGRIGDKWGEYRWETGFLGYPKTDEFTNPDGAGKRQQFEGATIYWSSSTDAHPVGGAIGDKWAAYGYEGGNLGYPISDEFSTPNGAARFNHFQRGSIYWSGSTGAVYLTREMMQIWGTQNYETGKMGLPARDTEIGASPAVTRSGEDAQSRAAAAAAPNPGTPQKQVFQRAVAGIISDGSAFIWGR